MTPVWRSTPWAALRVPSPPASAAKTPLTGDKVNLLLSRLQGVPWEKRSARFRCVIAIAFQGKVVGLCEGVCEGIISLEAQGSQGFGYDPVFYLPELRKTMAELSLEEKNRLSHRARAAEKAVELAAAPAPGVRPVSGISDSFQRPISYLRVSVTDRCNLRCVYCMPPEGIPLIPHADILRYEEILSVVRVAAEMGINRIRLSGGEPLARAGLADFVRMLAGVKEIDDLALTTNGVLLKEQAAGLKAAGLKRVNVSLDSLKRIRVQDITGHDGLPDVLGGIKAGREVGLAPIKINVVVMRGVNEDELLDFARLTLDGWNVRFIELMSIVNASTDTQNSSRRT